MNPLSKRAQSLQPSPTMAMANRARELQAEGKDVISLTVGEPDWRTFEVANEAGIAAINKGFTKYTAAHGTPELRQEIAKVTSAELGLSFSANEVAVGSGAKFILFASMMTLLDPGDEVLIPTPCWVSYPVMVELSGGVPKLIECSEAVHFKLTPEALKKAITPRTKMLILCSPSNPTGLQYSRSELAELAKVLKNNPQIFIVSDDIYNRLIFTKEEFSPHLLHVEPSLRQNLIVVNGASKTYSMTGWRIGWALGPAGIILPMANLLSQTTSSPSSISQQAALAALQKGGPELVKVRAELLRRKNRALELFKDVRGVKAIEPDGAFYIWLDVRSWLGKKHSKSQQILKGSKEVSEILLNEHWVATVPGVEFSCEGYLRLSFATSDQNMEKAAKRFSEMQALLS